MSLNPIPSLPTEQRLFTPDHLIPSGSIELGYESLVASKSKSFRAHAPSFEISSTDARRVIESLAQGIKEELHILRHFVSVPSEYMKEILGAEFEVIDSETRLSSKVTITNEMIDAALKTGGSKFFENLEGFQTPKEVIETVKKKLLDSIQKEKFVVYQYGDRFKFFAELEFPYNIGTRSVLTIDELTPDELCSLKREARGVLPGDEFQILVAASKRYLATKTLAVMIRIENECAFVDTTYPGILAPGFPGPNQSEIERTYAEEFWAKHVFLSVKS